MGKLIGIKFTLTSGKYVSEEILLDRSCVVGITLPSAGTVSVRRSIDNVNYADVQGSAQTAGSGYNEFSVNDAKPGQFIKIVSSVNPTKCTILL